MKYRGFHYLTFLSDVCLSWHFSSPVIGGPIHSLPLNGRISWDQMMRRSSLLSKPLLRVGARFSTACGHRDWFTAVQLVQAKCFFRKSGQKLCSLLNFAWIRKCQKLQFSNRLSCNCTHMHRVVCCSFACTKVKSNKR